VPYYSMRTVRMVRSKNDLFGLLLELVIHARRHVIRRAARRFSVSRNTARKWFSRFHEKGKACLRNPELTGAARTRRISSVMPNGRPTSKVFLCTRGNLYRWIGDLNVCLTSAPTWCILYYVRGGCFRFP